jgi:predicted ABC-type ATPase
VNAPHKAGLNCWPNSRLRIETGLAGDCWTERFRKTTVTRVLRRDHWSEGVEYINPDEIALERFGDWNSPTAILEAANWAEQRRETLLSERAGIAFETVFSASDKLDFVRRTKQAGYFVRMFSSAPVIRASMPPGLHNA